MRARWSGTVGTPRCKPLRCLAALQAKRFLLLGSPGLLKTSKCWPSEEPKNLRGFQIYFVLR